MRESEQQKSVLNTDLLQSHFKSNPSDLEWKQKLEAAEFKLSKAFPQFR